MRPAWAVVTIMLAGCAVIQPISKNATLILKPQVMAASRTQADVPSYSKSLINHLIVNLYPLQGEIEQALIASSSLINAQLDNPVVFANLRPNTKYRAKAQAYFTSDSSQLISTQDADSYTDIDVQDNDRPSVSNLKVRLIDRLFNATATSTVTITNGNYTPIGTESLKVLGLEGIVTVFAGTGATGSLDGYRTSATFNVPRYSSFDVAGNMYVSEWVGHRVRKITLDGMVTTLAGSGTAGYADGQGTLASFHTPSRPAIAPNGDVYVSDFYNHCIRKITPSGMVSTFAGSGSTGSSNGVGTAASFNGPSILVLDSEGNLYLGDYYNKVIRKITPDAVVSTYVGSGSAGYLDANGTNAVFWDIHQLAMDGQGNLYVADTLNRRIRKVTPDREVTTVAGNGVAAVWDGRGTNASFYEPTGIAVDARGVLYVADRAANRIRMISTDGMVSTLAGNGNLAVVEGTGYGASLMKPDGLGLDPQGNLYIGSYTDHRILRIQ